jgi:hypothetical protein
LSPTDWGDSAPHRFVGSYRLEADMSWTPADTTGASDESRQLVEGLLAAAPDDQV